MKLCAEPAASEAAESEHKMRLADVFCDHMVLQANAPIRFFGEGTGTVRVDFDGETQTVKSEKQWVITMHSRPYGGPYEVSVEMNGQRTVLKDVYVGETVLCAGQSNMAFCMAEEITPPEAYESDDLLRTFAVTRPVSHESFSSRDGWQRCQKESVFCWSAIGYHLGRAMRRAKSCAVGMIVCAQGASVIQSWVDAKTNELPCFRFPEGTVLHVDHSYYNDAGFNAPAFLYHAMAETLFPFSFGCTVWYQGESNTSMAEAERYADMLRALIDFWRKKDENDALPFYVVQIADTFDTPQWKRLQQAQSEAEDRENKIFVIRSGDVCEKGMIHPKTKKALAERIYEEMK